MVNALPKKHDTMIENFLHPYRVQYILSDTRECVHNGIIWAHNNDEVRVIAKQLFNGCVVLEIRRETFEGSEQDILPVARYINGEFRTFIHTDESTLHNMSDRCITSENKGYFEVSSSLDVSV